MTAAPDHDDPDIEIQREYPGDDLPADSLIQRCARSAVAGLGRVSLNIRIVDEAEGRELNRRWRKRNYATNVLSFPATLPSGTGIEVLGDIVLCAPVILREAREQGKSVEDHCAHLVIHGILHLRGFDHISAEQAEQMEAREIELLHGLNIANPYRSDEN